MSSIFLVQHVQTFTDSKRHATSTKSNHPHSIRIPTVRFRLLLAKNSYFVQQKNAWLEHFNLNLF